MTLQTHSALTSTRFAAVYSALFKALDWLQTCLKPGTAAPKSARLLRDVGIPEQPVQHGDVEQLHTYRDRHMPLL